MSAQSSFDVLYMCYVVNLATLLQKICSHSMLRQIFQIQRWQVLQFQNVLSTVIL